ncbi:MAG: SRPBCC family protein [Actinomycetota bacterium]|nr:SRPBCC family protein [Actinomycetota bacterium]
MAQVVAQTERLVAASPQRVRAFLVDYQNNRPRILPAEYFRDYRVEQGGDGAGTVISYRLRAGGRERAYRMRVEEPTEDGPILEERDTGSSLVTTWTLSPAGEGEQTMVSLTSRWEGASGIGGFFERMFAPRALRQLYGEVLEKLSAELRV